MTRDTESATTAHYLVGIDLGTTNSAVAYIDSTGKDWSVQDFPIPQLVEAGLVESKASLPSFHYEAAIGEFAESALRLPWTATGEETKNAVGAFARDHGASVPGRLVTSAKSWLSHSGVDRTAGLLPWHGAADLQKLSPVEVSARYLAHLRAAWDHAHPDHPLANQDVVLTVPASFDEVARELTVQAAKDAGLASFTLLEEPQAAFYAWIATHAADWERRVQAGQTILVCDVGGGTSDFTLIRVRSAGGRAMFHRVAVGEHLILGGDNLDLALARHIEQKLVEAGKLKLEQRQWGSLVRSARVVKETLLGHSPPDKTTVNIAGGGSKLIGSSVRLELTREEVERVLVDGFLPQVPLESRPAARRSGFQEFGLPYASDAAITRYLAAFLTSHRELIRREGIEGDHDPARPDVVLFNGGLFESPRLRDRLLNVLTEWFNDGSHGKWSPTVLENHRLDLAVARGAAYYGMVRRGKGERIRGGLAHSYYLGVETTAGTSAICLLPAGVEEGQTVDLPDRRFDLLIRQPVEFPLYYSGTRTTDRPGELVVVDEEQLTALPSIRTVLTSGRSASAATVQVELHARLTEIGTLEIWCSEVQGQRTWRLQFDVRAASQANAARHEGAAERQGVADDATLSAGKTAIEAAFRKNGEPPASLVKRVEAATDQTRWDWPASLMRGFWETQLDVEAGRRLSLEHETRWLSLTGFCLRPGYGLAVDDWRVAQMWKLFPAGVTFAKNEQVRAEWWILWRRIAGGLTPGQQATLADPLIADWRLFQRKQGVGVKGRPTFQFGPHESAEVWRLLGSLELLRPATKLELGNMLLERLAREKKLPVRDAILFAIGRVGARVPVYGPLNVMVEPPLAERWVTQLISMNPLDEKAVFAVVQLARKTGDRFRDLSDHVRATAVIWLQSRQAAAHLIELVQQGGTLAEEEQRNVFGESLPKGLRIE